MDLLDDMGVRKLSFTLKLFQTCMNFFLLLNTKEDILKNVGNQTVDHFPLTSIVWGKILWNSMGTINCLVTDILQNFLFVFSRRKKFIQFWNKLRVIF